jgi:hypothetical protein
MIESANSDVIDTIRGKSFLAVEAAARELARHKLEIVGYKITVVQRGNSVFVIFADQNAPPGMRGSGGKKPTFEVELNARDLSVVGSYFAR